MKKSLSITCFILFLSFYSSAVTLSGENVPYDSSFRLGLVNGPGTGVAIGADVFFPIEGFNIGADVEQQVANVGYEQNVNIFKIALATKYVINNDFYLVLSLGSASFYVSKFVEYRDSYSGDAHTIDDDTRGNASFWAIAPHFRIGEYFLSPKFAVNTIKNGGNLFEFDLNIVHKF